ncbi:MAG: hypothetical protein AAF226_05380 [Verrucomicrobiota bacterium]
MIITVHGEDFGTAREALESLYADLPLPDDHHLHSASDEDLIEILGNSADWSPFDVAKAKQMAADRQIDPEKVEQEQIESLARKQTGKPASPILLVATPILILVAVFTGHPLIWAMAIGIASSICFMREKSPQGNFYTFNAKSRKAGKLLFFAALGLLLFSIALRVFSNV